MYDDLIVVGNFSNHIDADLAQSALDAAHIESITRADDAGAMRPHMATSQGVQLYVKASDSERASEILSAPAIEAHEHR